MNLTIKKTKLISRMMLLLMIVSTFATTGCEFFTPSQTTENSQKEVINHEPQDLIDGLIAKMQAAGYEEMKAMVDFYAKAAYIDATYTYSIEIIDGNIYLHGYIFSDITYVTDYSLTFDKDILPYLNDEEKYKTLMKIQNHFGCYILTPQEDNNVGTKVIVYEIDGDYYFLSCYSNNDIVLKINKLNID